MTSRAFAVAGLRIMPLQLLIYIDKRPLRGNLRQVLKVDEGNGRGV